MQYKLSRSKKILLSTCVGTFLLTLFFAVFLLVSDGTPWQRTKVDFDTYRQQLIEINENYDRENRVIVFSKRRIEDNNCIASASGYGDMYVFQYASKAQAQDALAYYSSLRYVDSAMMDSAMNTQEDAAEVDEDIVVLDHLTWGAEILGVDSYWEAIDQKYGSTDKAPDVYVAVLDTGIDTDNEFLEGRIAYEWGKSFYPSELYKRNKSAYDFEDDHMHGTHVAGTIVDLTPDNVKIIPIKVLDAGGTGDVSDVLLGIIYLMDLKVNYGLNIVAMNMSLAADSTGYESTYYFDLAYENDIMSVVAAGNDSYYAEDYFPANCESALTVSALSQNSVYENFPFVAYYSNHGSVVDVCLPGSNVLSCVPNEYSYTQDYITSATGGKYAYLNGTSMATPHASALVALYATYMGSSYSTEKVEKALKKNAYDFGATGKDDVYGYGVPSMDLALADRELPETPTLSEGKVGVAHHFDNTISVNITNNSPDYKDMQYKIYYTLDGSYPTVNGNHFAYDNPIVLDESTHLSFVIYLFDGNGFIRGYSKLYEIEYFKGEKEDKNTNGTGFEINPNGILTRYTSGLQDIVIPASVGGIPVKELGNNLFFGLNVRSIVCEADISLANKASKDLEYPIRYCHNLESVTLGAHDATYAVAHCFGLKELILPNAENIAAAPFPSFTLGYSFLGSYTAYGCASLERIVAPKATWVGNSAFNYVTTLKDLELPKVNSIFGSAFIGCWGLREVELPGLMYAYDNTFNDCYKMRSFKAPMLKTIGSYAFANCVSLVDMDVSSVTNFGERALYNCMNLTTLDTSSAQVIGTNAFEKCRSLVGADLRSVTSFGETIFRDCSSLKAVYCGSNSYAISKSLAWGEWIYRYADLQYIVTDFGVSRGGMLNNFFYTCTNVGNYKVYTRDAVNLYTATFLDQDGNEIAKKYHVSNDPLNPPSGEVNEEYQINYLSWKSEKTSEIFNYGEEFHLTADDTFTLIDYNVYYFSYSEQAKGYYAELYQKLTGKIPAANDAVYSAIEQACTVSRAGDKEYVLKMVNDVIGGAVCDLLDNLLLESDSDAVVAIVEGAKSDILSVCENSTEIATLDEIIDDTLEAIETQRQEDIEAAKTAAKNSLREKTKDIYEKLSDERKSVAIDIYQKYDSKIDAADNSEFESIIDECRREFIIQNGLWALDDLLDGSEDEQILEIIYEAKSDIHRLDESSIEELQVEINAIIEKAKSDIEEYLASKDIPDEPEHQHVLTLVEEMAATCTVDGHIAYYICSGCDSWFADDKGESEIVDHDSVLIPAAHDYTDVKWSSNEEGHWLECAKCGEQTEKIEHNKAENGACSDCGYKATVDPDPDDGKDDETEPKDPIEPEPDSGDSGKPDEGETSGNGDVLKPSGCNAGLGMGLGSGLAGLAIIGVVGAILFVRRKKI